MILTPENPKAITPVQAKGGRPTKCQPERVRKLLDLVGKGIPYEPACRSLGISYRTMRRWVVQGEDPGSPEPYRQFCQDLMLTEAKAEAALARECLETARKARSWRGISWYLARRWPQRWGNKRETLPEESVPNPPVRRPQGLPGLKNMPIEDVRKLRDLLKQAHAD